MQELKKIKCQKCGTSNIYGAKYCCKCQEKLKDGYKTCPRCAKKNHFKAEKCINCGFKFAHQKSNSKSILINLFISIIIMLLLWLLVFLNKNGVVSNINKLLKILSSIMIIVLLISSINYNFKDKINYDNESEIKNKKEISSIMKYKSNIAIVIGSVIVLIILIYFYFKG